MALVYEELVPATYRTAFVEKVRAIASRLGIKPDWLMVVMRVETAGTFFPDKRNGAGSGAVGLIQFTDSGVTGLGVTTAQLAKMDALTQLDYVEKYLNPYASKISDVYDLYLSVFAPAYLGKPDSQILYSTYATTAVGKRQYELNKILDKNLDGSITIGEVKNAISRYVPAGMDTGESKAGLWIVLLIIGFILYKSVRA